MIRERVPDKFKATSLIDAAEMEMAFIKTLNVSLESGATIVSRIYENFRRLGEALMLIKGRESVGRGQHTDNINELFFLKVKTKRPIQVLENLKKIRMDINYNGYIPNIEEIRDALSIAESCFNQIVEEIKKELNRL